MSRWRDITEFLALRRNTSLLLVALALAGTGERLWLGFAPQLHRHEVAQLSEFHAGQHNQKAGSGQQHGIGRNGEEQSSCSHENDEN